MSRFIYRTCILVGVWFGFATFPLPAQDAKQLAMSREIRERQLAYRDALGNAIKVWETFYRDGRGGMHEFRRAQTALYKAGLDLTKDPAERIKILDANLGRLKHLESYAKAERQAGTAGPFETIETKSARIHGEILLLKERQRQHRSVKNNKQLDASRKIRERQVDYCHTLKDVVDARQKLLDLELPMSTKDGLLKAQIALGDAELETTSDPAERIRVLDANLGRLKKLELSNKTRIEVGVGRPDEFNESEANRIQGRLKLCQPRVGWS